MHVHVDWYGEFTEGEEHPHSHGEESEERAAHHPTPIQCHPETVNYESILYGHKTSQCNHIVGIYKIVKTRLNTYWDIAQIQGY